ncbi:MAG TPA: hypothetical protein VFB34_07715, partial [Chloroflexota bacterium]|nr:hypothetical protein [Chloroflexota bacterium]
ETNRTDELYKESLDTLRALGHKARFADTYFNYSIALRERGDFAGALEYALEAGRATGARF